MQGRGRETGDDRLETGDGGRKVSGLQSIVWSLPRSGGAGPDLSRASSRLETARLPARGGLVRLGCPSAVEGFG